MVAGGLLVRPLETLLRIVGVLRGLLMAPSWSQSARQPAAYSWSLYTRHWGSSW